MNPSQTTTGTNLPPPPPPQPLLPSAVTSTAPLPVEVPPIVGALEKQEDSSYKKEGQKLDFSLRKTAGFIGIGLAVLMYLAGMFAIGSFLGLWPCLVEPATAENWHTTVAILIALFSVPTVILLAIFRSTTAVRKDDEMDSIYAMIGQKFMALLEKWIDK